MSNEDYLLRLTQRLRNRLRFLGHIFTFVLVVLVVWTIWINTTPTPRVAFKDAAIFFSTLIWFALLVVHAIHFVTGEMRERAIEQALLAERVRAEQDDLEWDEKPKRKRLELSDDDEWFESETVSSEKSQSGSEG